MTLAPADWLDLLHEIAVRTEDVALRFFRARDLRVDEKPDRSPVSEADREIESVVRAIVGERYPELAILGEEEGETGAGPGGGGARLIVDPIDGTRNFVRGIPIFATLLAIEDEGEIVAGVANAPALGVRWHAARGEGAFRDGRAIHVSGVRHLDRALVLHGNLGTSEPAPPEGFLALARRAERTRGFGDFYQHVLVAEGAAEIALDPAVQPWDVAALQILVEEAGGRATTIHGERAIRGGSLLTTNGALHPAALAALA